jgi:hypothetical protein
MKNVSTLGRIRHCALAGTALAMAACSVPTTAPAAASGRELAVLQLESAVPLSATQPPSDAELWTPSVTDRRHLIVPPEVVEVADTVRAGQTVSVVVRTIGTDGCWSADGGVLSKSGDTLSIRPYDRHSGAAACTTVALVGGLEHRFITSFDAPGVGVIRVRGRRVQLGARDSGTPVMVERRVVVVP